MNYVCERVRQFKWQQMGRHGGLGRFRCVCVSVCIALLIWDLTDALSNNEVSTSDIWDHPIGVYLRCCMLGILIRGIIHDKNTTFDIRGIVHAYGDYTIYNIYNMYMYWLLTIFCGHAVSHRPRINQSRVSSHV